MQYGNARVSKQYEREYMTFKSYYVVWKPFSTSSFFSSVGSLNRTMQYGNCDRIEELDGLEESLNRTMQYGNCIVQKKKITRKKV